MDPQLTHYLANARRHELQRSARCCQVTSDSSPRGDRLAVFAVRTLPRRLPSAAPESRRQPHTVNPAPIKPPSKGGALSIPTDQTELRDIVRAKYAAAVTIDENTSAASCCSADGAIIDPAQREQFGSALYDQDDRDQLPQAAVLASLGCGNPIAIAELHEDETVLDLGSGGGIDVLLSAKRVGPTGLAYGLDMTDEMLDLARQNQAEAGVTNVQWLRGHIEDIPLPGDSVDVIISNCVINLSGDKHQVLREAARVLKPGGRFAVSDVVADPDMADATRADMQAYTGCIAGALTRDEFTDALEAAGLTDISITETHRVHAAAASAIVRATKPGGTLGSGQAASTDSPAADTAMPCCSSGAQATCCESSAKSECCDSAKHAVGTCGCSAGP
jgi:arsenite methyltransferase